jgi:ATP-dependent DNA helicase RecG
MMGNPQTEEGSLCKLIYNTVAKVESIVAEIPSTMQGDQVSYPRETLHEIITNAVLHRDYSIKDDIQIRILNDRVEVESPGILPGYITKSLLCNLKSTKIVSLSFAVGTLIRV